MVKSYSHKRTREEIIAAFKESIRRKKDYLRQHNLQEISLGALVEEV